MNSLKKSEKIPQTIQLCDNNLINFPHRKQGKEKKLLKKFSIKATVSITSHCTDSKSKTVAQVTF